ncbi:MAG: hypothetical protein ACXWEW_11895, partial [Nitrososphaeraceae archaeon]
IIYKMSETKSYEEPDNTAIHNDAALMIYNTLVSVIKRVEKLEEVVETIHNQVKENREKNIEFQGSIDKIISQYFADFYNRIHTLQDENNDLDTKIVKQGDIIDDLVSSRLQAETDLLTVFNLHKTLQNRINRISKETSVVAGESP